MYKLILLKKRLVEKGYSREELDINTEEVKQMDRKVFFKNRDKIEGETNASIDIASFTEFGI